MRIKMGMHYDPHTLREPWEYSDATVQLLCALLDLDPILVDPDLFSVASHDFVVNKRIALRPAADYG